MEYAPTLAYQPTIPTKGSADCAYSPAWSASPLIDVSAVVLGTVFTR